MTVTYPSMSRKSSEVQDVTPSCISPCLGSVTLMLDLCQTNIQLLAIHMVISKKKPTQHPVYTGLDNRSMLQSSQNWQTVWFYHCIFYRAKKTRPTGKIEKF